MLVLSCYAADCEVLKRRQVALTRQGVVAAAVALACLVGCGAGSGGGAHLQGKVTIGGKDVPAEAKAHIMFAPEAGKPDETVAAPITGSRYDAPNVPLGPVKVHFDITQAVGPMKRSERTGAEYQDMVNLVPAERAAGIPLEVAGDKSDQDFNL